MKLETLKKELLKDNAFKKEYERKDDLSFEISEMLIKARIEKGMTQEELAKRIKTKQSSIARIESGNFLPSLSFLQKIANALGLSLIPPRFSLDNENVTGTKELKNRILSNEPALFNVIVLGASSENKRSAKWEISEGINN